MKKLIISSLFFLIIFSTQAQIAAAQATAFTYQGKLTEAGAPASGQYDFTFRLFDSAGDQIGSDAVRENIQVTDGIFTVNLDFGAVPFNSATGNFLEIAVRAGTSSGAFTTLSPRQLIASAPYAVKSLNSATAETAINSLQLGGTAANQFVQTNDARLSDARPPTAGSVNYIQNSTNQQELTNFNISGNGTVGGTLSGNVISAGTQFNIGNSRVLSVSGFNLTNTFVGIEAGDSNPTGRFNSLFGNGAGRFITTGENNSFFGSGAGNLNVGGNDNAFFGRNAGLANTASDNAFFGSFAGAANTSGAANSFFGKEAGRTNTTGSSNSFFGNNSGYNSNGESNSFFGAATGFNNSSGFENSFFGATAGNKNTAGYKNSFVGSAAGRENAEGFHNSFFGAGSGLLNISGDSNSFFGSASGERNTSGRQNSFFGVRAGGRNTTGENNSIFGANAGNGGSSIEFTGASNSFFGYASGGNNTSGSFNTFIGGSTGRINTTGSNNTFIGHNAGLVVTDGNSNTLIGANTVVPEGLSFATAIGAGALAFGSNSITLGRSGGEDSIYTWGNVFFHGQNLFVSQKIHIGGDIQWNRNTSGANLPVCWSSSNALLHFCSSSVRFKQNVQTLGIGLDTIKRLRPVTFDWKSNNEADLGLIAEEVNEINPLLTIRNNNGELEGVKYDRVGVVLVSAVQEQQQQIEAQAAQIKEQQEQLKRQQTEIEALKKLVCLQNRTADVCQRRSF